MRSRRLWNRLSCFGPRSYAKGATGPSFSLVALPLFPPDICRLVDYFPNIFEKNPCFLTFSSRKDPSRFVSACGDAAAASVAADTDNLV